MSAFTRQVDGDHYRTLRIQPAEFITACGLGYLEGSAVKYVVRHRSKGGAQDIRKAIHCLEMLLELSYPSHDGAPSG
jgi:hypothetical protein